MADQRNITLWEFDATPTTVVLRSLPIADPQAESVCFLYPVLPPAAPSGTDPRDITLWEFDATPTTIILRSLPNYTIAAPNVIITIRSLVTATEEAPPEPPGEYYAVLKRWDGSAWQKAKLMVYTGGSFQAATLKVWAAGAWQSVDTTGV